MKKVISLALFGLMASVSAFAAHYGQIVILGNGQYFNVDLINPTNHSDYSQVGALASRPVNLHMPAGNTLNGIIIGIEMKDVADFTLGTPQCFGGGQASNGNPVMATEINEQDQQNPTDLSRKVSAMAYNISLPYAEGASCDIALTSTTTGHVINIHVINE